MSTISTIRLSEVIQNQSIYNVGTTGHVMHGKSTLVAKITGQKTQRHKEEQEKNITINLGYANFKVYIDKETGTVHAFPSDSKYATGPDGAQLELLYQISFVDCPGHKAYMSTMISGSNIMDSALVLVAANEQIPQPQTHDHIMALDYSGIEKKLFVLNKLDLLKEKDCGVVHERLTSYLKSTLGEAEQTIYPISAATGENVDSLVRYISGLVSARVPRIIESAKERLLMYIVRSYNVNRPNADIESLVGAVIGGTIHTGVLAVGDQVEIRPGVITMKGGKKVLQPLVARVQSMQSDKNKMQVAIPGGLIGVNLSLFAGLANSDRLKGQVLGHVGHMPDVYDALSGTYHMVDFDLTKSSTVKLEDYPEIQVVVNGVMNVKATVVELKRSREGKEGSGKGKIKLKLSTPVVMSLEQNNRVAFMIQNTLVASMKVREGSCSLPIVYPEGVDRDWTPATYEIVDDLIPFQSEPEPYADLLSKISFRSSRVKQQTLVVPQLNIVNMSTCITKAELEKLVQSLCFSESAGISSCIDIAEAILLNAAKELPNSKPRRNEDGSTIMTGRIKARSFASFLRDFQQKLYQCPSCRGTRCTLSEDKACYQRHCHDCPAVTFLHSLEMSKL